MGVYWFNLTFLCVEAFLEVFSPHFHHRSDYNRHLAYCQSSHPKAVGEVLCGNEWIGFEFRFTVPAISNNSKRSQS